MLSSVPDLEWSFLAPSAELESGQRTGHFRLGGDQLLADENGRSHISVQDYALAMINELENARPCPSALHCRVLIAQTEGQPDADLNAAKALSRGMHVDRDI